MHNRSSKIIACFRLLTCDSGPKSESANYYRLQLRLRLQTKRSTPTNSNSGFDSDSAALVLRMFICSVFYQIYIPLVQMNWTFFFCTITVGCFIRIRHVLKLDPRTWGTSDPPPPRPSPHTLYFSWITGFKCYGLQKKLPALFSRQFYTPLLKVSWPWPDEAELVTPKVG